MAQSGRGDGAQGCLLSGVERTPRLLDRMSAYDEADGEENYDGGG